MKIRRVNMQTFLDSNSLIQGENRDIYEETEKLSNKRCKNQSNSIIQIDII